jgi:hypothetical protein
MTLIALSFGNAISQEDAVVDGDQCAGRMIKAMRPEKGACRHAPPVGISGEGGTQTGPSGAHSWPLRDNCRVGMGWLFISYTLDASWHNR